MLAFFLGATLTAWGGFPKFSSQEQLLSAGLLSGTAVICLLGAISFLACSWNGSKLILVSDEKWELIA